MCCFLALFKISLCLSLVRADQPNARQKSYLSPRVQVLYLRALSAVGSSYAVLNIIYAIVFVEALGWLVGYILVFIGKLALRTVV